MVVLPNQEIQINLCFGCCGNGCRGVAVGVFCCQCRDGFGIGAKGEGEGPWKNLCGRLLQHSSMSELPRLEGTFSLTVGCPYYKRTRTTDKAHGGSFRALYLLYFPNVPTRTRQQLPRGSNLLHPWMQCPGGLLGRCPANGADQEAGSGARMQLQRQSRNLNETRTTWSQSIIVLYNAQAAQPSKPPRFVGSERFVVM